MGKYEQIAIELLESAFGDRWTRDDSRVFPFGPNAGTGEVDGTLDGRIAVEIGVGSAKQVRASVLDLIFHPMPGKLLILVDTPGHSTERSVMQAATILARSGCSGVVLRVCKDDGVNNRADDLREIATNHFMETRKSMGRVWAVSEPDRPPVIVSQPSA